MSLQKVWKSTGTINAPSGRRRRGTFRDVSLSGLPSELIDEVDSACIERSISRSRYILEYWQECENWDESVFPIEAVRAAAQIEPITVPSGHQDARIFEARPMPLRHQASDEIPHLRLLSDE